MDDARRWCEGHIVDERPALAHAVAVTSAITEHVEHPQPAVLAAALLHDAPEFAPAALDLHAHLVNAYGQQTTELIFDLYAEHQLLDQPDPAVSVHRPDLALLSTADKAVAFGSLLRRAYLSGNVPGYFAARPGLRSLLGYFRSYQRAVIGHVPDTLSTGLGALLDQVEQAVADSADRR